MAEGLKLRFDCEIDTVHEGDDSDYELSIFKMDNGIWYQEINSDG